MVRRHGETNFEIVTGPEVPIREQIADSKKVAQSGDRTHPEYAEIQVWVSDVGISKSIRFKPEPKPEAKSVTPKPEVERPTTPPETHLESPPEVVIPQPAEAQEPHTAPPVKESPKPVSAAATSPAQPKPKKPSGKTA